MMRLIWIVLIAATELKSLHANYIPPQGPPYTKCYDGDNLAGCRLVTADMVADRECRMAKWHHQNLLMVLRYMKQGSTHMSDNCFYGKMMVSEIIPCGEFVSGAVQEAVIPEGESNKVNLALLFPLVKTGTGINCTAPVTKFLHYTPGTLSGIANIIASKLDGQIRVNYGSFPVKFTSQGANDPYQENTGTLDLAPFWNRLSELVVGTGLTPQRQAYITEVMKKYVSTARVRRSVYPGVDKTPNDETCTDFGQWFGQAKAYSGWSCSRAKVKWGAFWLCDLTPRMKHCYMDRSGGWEDGGIHEVCNQMIHDFVTLLTRCSTLDLQSFVMNADAHLVNLITNVEHVNIAQTGLIELNKKALDIHETAIDNNYDLIVGLGKSIKDTETFYNRFLGSYENFTEAVGAIIFQNMRDLELVQVQIVELQREALREARLNLGDRSELSSLNFSVHHDNGTARSHMMEQFEYVSQQAQFLHQLQTQNLTNLMALGARRHNTYTSAFKNVSETFAVQLNKTKEMEANLTDALNQTSAAIQTNLAIVKEEMDRNRKADYAAAESMSSAFGTPGKVGVFAATMGMGGVLLIAVVIIVICMCMMQRNAA